MASAKNEARIKFTAETGEFTAALKDAKNEMGLLGSQLKLADATFKNTGNSVEFLKSKSEILKQQLQANAEKQQALTGKLEAAKRIYGEDSEEVRKLERQLVAARTEEQNLTNELNKTNRELEEQTRKASATAQAVEKIGETGEKLQKAGKSIQGVGEKLMPVSMAVGAVGAMGAKSFAEVDKTMQLTNQTMKNTEEEAELLNRAMKDAAANSTMGMKEAAGATLNFARAGLDAKQAAAALAPSMNLAAGEGGNLNTVSKGLVGTINGFGDSFDNAAHYADVFAAACNNSALDVDSLSNAMGTAAPVFKTAEKEVEDAALYMGVMANANIDANTSANALKTGIMRLADPAKGARDAMEKYGIAASAVWGKDGTMKDTVEIQRNLHESFQTLSEKEQLAAASAIFGKNQGAAWLALINTAPDEVEALSDSLENCAGTTEEMANAMMSGFGGSLERLKSSVDVLVTSLGESLAPTIQKVTDIIQGVVDKLNGMDENHRQTVVTIGLVVAALGPALVIGGKVIDTVGTAMTHIKNIVPLITKLNAVIAANPMAAVVIAIMAVVAALVYLYNNCEEFRKFVDGLMAAIKAVVVGAITAVQQKVTEILNKIKTVVTTATTAIKNRITGAWNGIKNTTTSVWNAVKNGITTAINGAKNTVSSVTGAIRSTVTTAWNTVKNGTGTAWTNVKSTISNKLSEAKTAVSNNMGGIKDKMSSIGDSIKNTARDKFNGVKEAMVSKIEEAKDKVKRQLDKVKNLFPLKIGKVFTGLKLPKISVSGGSPPFGIGGKGSLPSFSVTWNKLGAIFSRPTIFPTPMGWQGVGEAGPEAVSPISVLQDYVSDAVRANVPQLDYDRLGDSVAKACARMNVKISMDHREVGRLVREYV